MTRSEYEQLARKLAELAEAQRERGEPIRDVADLIGAMLPQTGPYDAPSTVAAAEVMDEAARYLAHATLAPEAAPNVSDLYAVIGAMGAMGARLQQVLRQMSHRLEHHTPVGTGLYDDRMTSEPATRAQAQAVRTRDAAVQGMEHAIRELNAVGSALASSQMALGHLGNEPRYDPDDGVDESDSGVIL